MPESFHFYESMAAHDLEVDEKLIANGYFVSESAKYFVSTFLKNGATAIVCGNDLIAYGVIKECNRLGYRIPEDISVVGFDDLPLSSRITPMLTTIRQERIELGKCGYMALHSLINHVSVSKTLLRPQLILRESTLDCNEISHS